MATGQPMAAETAVQDRRAVLAALAAVNARPSVEPIGEVRYGKGPYAEWTRAFIQRAAKSPRPPAAPFSPSDMEFIFSQVLVLVAKGSGPLGTGQAQVIVEITGMSRGLTATFLGEVTQANRSSGVLMQRLRDLASTAGAMEAAGQMRDVPPFIAVLNGMGQAVAAATQAGYVERLRALDAVLTGVERIMRGASAPKAAPAARQVRQEEDGWDGDVEDVYDPDNDGDGSGPGTAEAALADFMDDPTAPVPAAVAKPPRPPAPPKPAKVGLDAIVEEIEALAGIPGAKREALDIVDHVRLAATRKECGLPPFKASRNFVMLGNPGTGKSELAALIARVYGHFGLLTNGNVAEVEGADLADRDGTGGSAARTRAAMERARGGILVIDRPEGIVRGEGDAAGQEAIDALVRVMRDPRVDIVVALSGAEGPVSAFLAAHTRLAEHLPRTVRFPDHGLAEMLAILARFARTARVGFDNDARLRSMAAMERLCAAPGPGFRNGHAARELFEAILSRQAERVRRRGAPAGDGVRAVLAADVVAAEAFLARPAA